MGARVSSDAVLVHQLSKPDQSMDYAAKPASFVIASPIGDKPSSMVIRPMPEELASQYRLSSAKFRSFGSKEDVFFESQPWLESDGDDDFFSVNGDLTPSITPSSSNTPIHRNLLPAPSHPPEDITAGYKLTLSPAKRRKSLSELFMESEDAVQENSNQGSEKETDEDRMEFSPTAEAPKSGSSTSYFPKPDFTDSSDHVKLRKDRSHKSAAQRCLPRLFSVSSPNIAKKHTVTEA